jgi:hypothetical protein
MIPHPIQPTSNPASLRAAIPLLALLAANSLAQTPLKVPRPLPVMSDVKTPPQPATLTETAPKRAVPPGHEASAVVPKTSADARGPDAPAIDFSRVVFDQPGDGATWARGRTYKASFDAAGVTYIPFLGSNAPRNFPVRCGSSRRASAVRSSRSRRTACRSPATT